MTDRKIPLAAAIFAVLNPATAALAQSTPAANALEPVIVTATRREINMQDVAQSVTALSTEDIQKQAFTSLDDVAGALPSVTLVNALPGRNDIIMRGISTGTGEYYTDSQVSVYLDDQPMTSSSQQVDVRLVDIERIEVLPGPQGTLFGSSSQSGTIRYVTNKPDPSGYSSQVDVEVGTTKGGEESYDVSGHVNIPLSDKFAIRAVGFYAHEGGYVDNVLGENLSGTADNADAVEKNWNDYETTGGRFGALWQISPKWQASLNFVSQYDDTNGDWLTDPAIGDYKIVSFYDEYRDDDWYQTSATVKGDLGFAELSATASWFDRHIEYQWDNTLYENWRTAHAVQYGWSGLYDTAYLGGTTFNVQKQNRWTYEVRLTSEGESRLQWMAGAFYEDVWDWWHYGAKVPNLKSTTAWYYANYYADYFGADVVPLPKTNEYYTNFFEKTVRQKAFFGEMTYDLTDQWSVTGGARWFEFDRHEVETNEVPRGLPVFDYDPDVGYFLAAPLVSEGTDSDTIMKFATQYRFDDTKMLYALYSEGFRLGGTNSQRAAARGLIPEHYKPDTMQNYEAGFKSQWLDNRLLVNVSLFFMEWSDIQLRADASADDPWWVEGIFNGGKAEQKGIELQTEWHPTDRFSVEIGGFVANPEFSESFETPAGSPVEKGWPMPDSPEEKFWAAFEYRVPGFLIQNGDFWTRFSYSYQGPFWNGLDDIRCVQNPIVDGEPWCPTADDIADAKDQKVPSWSTSTLQFGVSSNNGWDAALIIRNLFDEDAAGYMSGGDYGEFFGDPRFRYRVTPQRPRTVSLSFTKRW
ncbi:MAG TPA: TonB-dependent receptor [Steroidobacteraceae bacterium]|jgi:outer membrane receptor protein involved in Fe transport|nr:TonB-dependent receptor [Steroidobacteraceae bacterium]